MMKITGTFVQPLCGGDIPAMGCRTRIDEKDRH